MLWHLTSAIFMIFSAGFYLASASSCSHQRSVPSVVDGQQTDLYPGVVALAMQDKQGLSLGVCTGEFISDRIVLTAAHCFEDDATPILIVDKQRIEALRWIIHPQYVAYADDSVRYDLAMIEFKNYRHPYQVQIAKQVADLSRAVTIVGYGKHTFTTLPGLGIGVKRAGKSHIALRGEGFFQIIKNTSDTALAAAAPGDSGGALLLDNAELIGITSLGAPEGRDKIVNQFVDLLSASSQSFLATPEWMVEAGKN